MNKELAQYEISGNFEFRRKRYLEDEGEKIEVCGKDNTHAQHVLIAS